MTGPSIIATPYQVRAVGRYLPSIIWGLVLATVLIIPFKIISYGYLPSDDALRHAAKAVSGKTWPEILVLREDFTIDHNAGWHVLLRAIHLLTDWDAEDLVRFSMVSLFLLIALSALPWLRRPEAWPATLLIMNVASMQLLFRLTMGRPLLVPVAVLITILFAWTRRKTARSPLLLFGGTVLFIALAVWIHGSWYLFAIPVAAFLLARRFREAFGLAVCWLLGSILGAAATGDPVRFLGQHLRLLEFSVRHYNVAIQLVGEMQPTDGVFNMIVIIGGLLVFRKVRGGRGEPLFSDPVFLLILLGWLLGLKIQRFWLEWGWPAALVWVAREFQQILIEYQPGFSLKRLISAILICVAFFLSATGDYYGRWTNNLEIEYIAPDTPGLAGWLPGRGGIIYSNDRRIFYRTFMKNPKADWRYLPGFEPTLMPPKDFAIFRRIQFLRSAPASFLPWIAAMRSADRLILHGSATHPPNLPQLEWRYGARNTWIGRLPEEVRKDE